MNTWDLETVTAWWGPLNLPLVEASDELNNPGGMCTGRKQDFVFLHFKWKASEQGMTSNRKREEGEKPKVRLQSFSWRRRRREYICLLNVNDAKTPLPSFFFPEDVKSGFSHRGCTVKCSWANTGRENATGPPCVFKVIPDIVHFHSAAPWKWRNNYGVERAWRTRAAIEEEDVDEIKETRAMESCCCR